MKSHEGHIAAGQTATGKKGQFWQPASFYSWAPIYNHWPALNLAFQICIFWVDHMSSFVHLTFHTPKAVQELIQSKKEFKKFEGHWNVQIKSIRADDGAYGAQATLSLPPKNRWRSTLVVVRF